MRYSNRFIYYFCAIHYLKGKKLKDFNELIKSESIKTDKQFLKILFDFFDIELLKDNSYIWQDIWVYNNMKYENFSKRSKLLNQYEKNIILPEMKKDKGIYDKMLVWGTYYLITK